MIKVHEGLGGWSIEVTKGGKPIRRFDCSQYIKKDERGIPWYDFDRAMRDAKKADKQK